MSNLKLPSVRGGRVRVVFFLGGNCLEGKCPGRVFFLGGKCPGESCPRNCLVVELSGGELSGGNCLGGNLPRTIFWDVGACLEYSESVIRKILTFWFDKRRP